MFLTKIFKIFKRNKKVNKIDFSSFNMNMTIKSICLFERMTGKTIFSMTDDEDDILHLLYCSFIESNPEKGRITYNVFKAMVKSNPKVAEWIMGQYKDIMDVLTPLMNSPKKDDANDGDSEGTTMNVTDMATSLIIDYGVDAHYVMYEMSLWELYPFYDTAAAHMRNHLEEQRLWTYIGIAPHIDGKKIKSPQDILPFAWEEKEMKNKKEKELKNNEYAIKHTIGMKLDI